MTEFKPSVRECIVKKLEHSYGFHLSRTQWDPYPWISNVDTESAANEAGVLVGDCLLEVNGEDVIGLRIADIAEKVRQDETKVKLLLWNPGCSQDIVDDVGPTSRNLQRFQACIQSTIKLLECPICLECVTPPVYQCYNGHILCSPCREQSEKCPICRIAMGRGRCLLAEKLNLILLSILSMEAMHPKEQSSHDVILMSKRFKDCVLQNNVDLEENLILDNENS